MVSVSREGCPGQASFTGFANVTLEVTLLLTGGIASHTNSNHLVNTSLYKKDRAFYEAQSIWLNAFDCSVFISLPLIASSGSSKPRHCRIVIWYIFIDLLILNMKEIVAVQVKECFLVYSRS